jgi:hypothetical protein
VADLRFPPLDQPVLFDTGAWTWTRDRRFPELTAWFNATVEAGLVVRQATFAVLTTARNLASSTLRLRQAM